jgi:hypothetical protein
MHNPTRRFFIRVRKETRGLVPCTWARFPRKLAPRSIANSARSLGAHIPHSIPRIVAGMRKREWKNLISVPPRKAARNPIP